MNRLLLGVAPLALALGLAGCQNPPHLTPASVANDIVLLDTSLQTEVAQLQGVTVPPAVTVALADLNDVAKAIGAADTLAAAQPLVVRVEADVNAVVAAEASNPNLPPKLHLWVSNAQALLPAVEAAVNLFVPTAAASPNGLTAQEAREALQSLGR